MNYSFVAQNFSGFAEVIPHVALQTNPIKITAESVFQIDLRNITRSPDPFRPADQMAHLPGPKLPIDFRLDLYSKRTGNSLRNFAHANGFAAADIHWQPIERIRFGSEEISPRNILHKRKIAGLFSIFVEHRRQTVEQTRAENRDHAGVGVEDRLSRPVGAGITKRDCWDPGLFSPKQHQFLLIDLRSAIN